MSGMTTYFIRRFENGWLEFMIVLPLLKFVIPFVVMAPRNNKRKPTILTPLLKASARR